MYSIAISGKAKSGKNTLAEIIKTELGQGGMICAFADPIKEMANVLFPEEIHKESLWGPSERREDVIVNQCDCLDDCRCEGSPLNDNLTYRKVLLDIGSLGRKYNQNIWTNLLIKKYRIALKNKLPVFIVSDLRFRNEFDRLANKNFFLIRIKRNNKKIINDVSETEQDGIIDLEFDWIIDNNASIDSLRKSIKPMIEKIKKIQ